jgi:DNA helicase-2/ATP-dependent DNA helicase PcrA
MRDAIQTKAFAPKPSSKMFTNPYTSSNSNSRSDVPTKTGPRIYDGTASKQTETSDGMLGYEVGDSVIHKKFGVGTVKAIREGGRDFEVTVDFPSWGVKKMFAAFAKLEKVEE